MDDNMTPIFDSVVSDLKFNPKDSYMEPANPAFTSLGYKKRKQIAGYANRAIAEVSRPVTIVTADVRKDGL